MEMRFSADSAEEMRRWAERLGRLLAAGDCVTLAGGLGAGKTTFAQGLARGLGVTKVVNSPTFTLVKEYYGRLPFYHMDLYRLDDAGEALGLDEYWDGDGVTVVEWPEVVTPYLPDDRIDIRIERGDGERRNVIAQATGSESARRLAQWQTVGGAADGGRDGE